MLRAVLDVVIPGTNSPRSSSEMYNFFVFFSIVKFLSFITTEFVKVVNGRF